jgi:GNAT superfamily N-acetyltransferase
MKYDIELSAITLKPIKVTYFEMHERPSLFVEQSNVEFRLLKKPIDTATYLSYYSEVGKQHFWLDRMVMSEEELSGLINAENIDIFVMYVNGEPAGYAEFIIEKEFTELLYFGLLPAFIGKGLGKYALDWAINKAWNYNPKWIQLNTCELDHPYAIANYKARGFKEVKNEIHQRKVIVK